jgi:hypothetical protein
MRKYGGSKYDIKKKYSESNNEICVKWEIIWKFSG